MGLRYFVLSSGTKLEMSMGVGKVFTYASLAILA